MVGQGGGQLRQRYIGTHHRIGSTAFGECSTNFVGGKKQVGAGGGLIFVGILRNKPAAHAGVIELIGDVALFELFQICIQIQFF